MPTMAILRCLLLALMAWNWRAACRSAMMVMAGACRLLESCYDGDEGAD